MERTKANHLAPFERTGTYSEKQIEKRDGEEETQPNVITHTLRGGVHGELELGALAKVHRQALHEEGTEAGASAAAERVKEQEALRKGRWRGRECQVSKLLKREEEGIGRRQLVFFPYEKVQLPKISPPTTYAPLPGEYSSAMLRLTESSATNDPRKQRR